MRPTVLEVSSKNFKYNISQIQKHIGNHVCLIPVLKADAYGTYINKNLDLIKDFKIVAVAIADEGKALREIGFENEILILNQPYESEIETILQYNLTVGAASLDFLKKLNSAARTSKYHCHYSFRS